MTPHAPARLVSLLCSLTVGAALLVSQPAIAAPVEGSVTASVLLPYSGNCDITGDDDSDTRTFTSAGRGRTTATASYEGTESGNPLNVAFTGNGTATTKGSATAKGGSLDRARIRGRHLVSLTNTGSWHCDAEVTADSQTGTSFVIKRKAAGKVAVSWKRSEGGVIAAINLVGPGGRTVVSFSPKKPTGQRTVRLGGGSYYLFVQFVTVANEDTPLVGETVQQDVRFKVIAKRVAR